RGDRSGRTRATVGPAWPGRRGRPFTRRARPTRWLASMGEDRPKDVGDRQPDALLERLDSLTAEVRGLNRRLDSGENLAPIVRELALLNESLQALAYAGVGQRGPQVSPRRGG